MARNPNPYYWYFGIPAFNMAHKFVYMNDLADTSRNSNLGIIAAKQHLYSEARGAVAAIGAEIGSSDSAAIASAFDFLKAVADSERSKELTVIKDYQDVLRKCLPKNKDIDKFLNKLNANILDDPQSMIDFYIELTDYLNVIRTSVKDYKQRLETLQKHATTTMDKLANDDYRFRAAGDTQALLNNITGQATRAQEKKLNSYASKIRQASKDYLVNSGLIDRLQSGEDVAAAIAVIALDIQKEMQKELDEQHLDDLTDISDEVFQKIVDNYNNSNVQYQTNLQPAIDDDQEELNNILTAAKTILNIHLLDESKRKERDRILNRRKRQLGEDRNLYKQLSHAFNNNSAVQELQYIDFNVGAKSSAHGNIYELINVVNTGNTVKIGGPTGADTLHLGSVQFTYETADIQKQLKPVLSSIENIITKYELQVRKDRFDDRTEQEIAMNNEIQEAIDQVNELIESLEIPLDNLFVYHESLKLYKTVETGEKGGFHGRDLTIMHYLDKLYSANGTAGLVLPIRDSLDFLLLNIPNGAVGEGLQSTLEDYLSIFAGMLMFDDIKLMADDAVKQMQNQPMGTVKQIHLYNLNGVYVPASMLLTFIYESMKHLTDMTMQGYAARATINTSAADSVISGYLATRPVPIKPQWQAVASGVAAGVKIRINILGAFTTLIQNLGV